MPPLNQTRSAPASPGRLQWASFAKGVAIIMVVGFHATLYLQSSGVDAVLGRAKALFELFPMPAFFLIAGILAVRQQEWSLRDLWKRRLRPLIYLYVLWSVIRTVFYFAVPGLNGELGELPATSPYALPLILFWPSSSYWFLYAMFLFTLFAWLLRGLPVAARVGIAAAVSTVFSSGLVDSGNIGWNRVGALFVFFVIGIAFAKPIKALVERATAAQFALALAVTLACAALALFGFRWVPFLVLLGQLAAVACGLIASKALARVPALDVVSRLGDSSLQIYLLHLFVIVPAVAIVGLLQPSWPRPVDVAVQLALTVLTLVLSMLLARLTARVHWLYLPPRRRRTPAASTPHGMTEAKTPVPTSHTRR